MSKSFDTLVFIARCQPVHLGHLHIVKIALQKAHNVIILLGSAHQPRSLRNPFTWGERATMLRASLDSSTESRVSIAPLQDTCDDPSWVAQVQSIVSMYTKAHDCIGLIGHAKDSSSYYLNLFPQWGDVEVNNVDGLSATPMREDFFMGILPSYNQTSSEVVDYLLEFKHTQDYRDLVAEDQFIRDYKKPYDALPWPVTFQTVDAVVIQSGYILMIERGIAPGAGLIALPGGFVDPDETLLDAMLRELREEAKIKVPRPVLKGNVVAERTFDDPQRGERGRMITQAFLIQLPPGELPRIKAGDDAAKAMWIPISDLDSNVIFSDHYLIIQKMLGLAK